MAGLFGGGSPPPTPQVAVAPPLPDPNSPSVIEAQNAAATAAMARGGRQSTITGRADMSSPRPRNNPSVASDAYSGTRLGTN